MIPNNLPCMIGINDSIDKVISETLSGATDLPESLARLSYYFIIKASFSEPVILYKKKPRKIISFRSLFISSRERLCYGLRRKARTGFPLEGIDKMIEFEVIQEDHSFKSFESFKKKFDLKFIKESYIQKLWNKRSSGHGGKYNKKDFRRIGSTGKDVLRRFLKCFNSLTTKSDSYRRSSVYEDDEVYVLTQKHYSNGNGRDISISHQTNNNNFIYYSSEYAGCLNGSYGILANKNEYLWMEDD